MSKKIKNIRIIDQGTNPDVDTDFHTIGRGKAIKYVQKKYGTNNVATIYTPGPFKAKNSFKSMATIYNLPFSVSNKISSSLPDSTEKGIHLKSYLDEDNPAGAEFRALLINDTYKEVAKSASEIEGRMRETGTHACGMVISSEPLTNTIPTEIRQNDGLTVTQWNYYDCESLGLIKMDFLGLDTIDLNHLANKFIKMTTGKEVDLKDLIHGSLDDKKTFELFQKADTNGIFQFSGSGVQDMLLNVKPDTFEDLPAITALYRPGPMGMNAHNEFAEKKNNIEARIPANEVDFIGTKVEDILKPTLGLLVYQEQIMTISKECAGFTSREADDLRKAIGKKKMDLMKSLGGKFKSGMIANGYPEKAVNNLWEGIVGFGQYSFNKSHSVSYALLAYQSAYLKAHYPTEFMCAVARQRQGDDKKFKPILAEIRKRGINILPASVNSSAQELQPSIELKNTIVYGLNAIKGLSGNIATEIQLEREENGKYKNLSDFIKRLIPRGLTKGALITLAKVGAFDDMNISRKAIVDNADKLFSLGKKKAEKANKLTLFSGMNLDQSPTFIDLPKEDYSFAESAKLEADLTGFFLSHSPMDNIKQIKDYDLENLNLTDDIVFYGTIAKLEAKTTKTKFKMLNGLIDNKISQAEFKFSNNLYKSIQKYNILENIIQEFDGITEVNQIEFHKNRNEIYKKAILQLDLKNKEEAQEWLNLPIIKVPDTNVLYKFTLGYTNKRNYANGNKFSRIEVLNIEEVPLSNNGKLAFPIIAKDKRKEDLYIKKLKETKGHDVIRLIYLDKSYTDVEDVTFMSGTTQADISNIDFI